MALRSAVFNPLGTTLHHIAFATVPLPTSTNPLAATSCMTLSGLWLCLEGMKSY